MPNWGNIILTNAGKALEDAVKAGGSSTSINFTKWKLGSGTLPSGGNWETRTDLVAPVMNIPVTSSEAQSTGGTLVSGVATNKDLTVGFNMKELGLFATGTDGGEILYGVLVDSNPDYLSAKEGTTVTTVDFSVLIVVDDDLKVTATLSADSLLRLKDLTAHNESATAHAAQFNNTLVDLKTNGNAIQAVKGDGTNVDVVVPYAVGTTTLKLQSNELTLDMGGGTQTNINIGQAPKNYSGSGFTYTFYNGKNSLADVVAKTQAVTDNSNNVATTAFVQSTVANKVSLLVNSAPETLDTLNELANALGNDPNFATTVTKMIGQKADKTVVDNLVNVMYPVGIIVEFAKDVDPNTVWKGTTWERMSNGRVLVSSGTSGSGTTYTLGATGGEESHQLTTNEMPSHNHGTNTSGSGGHTHTGTTSTNGNHTHTLHKGSGGSGGAYFSQGQVYGAASGTVTPPDYAGDHNHSFTTSNSGDHTHAINSDGGSQAHNNMQPYEVVNRWKRTA